MTRPDMQGIILRAGDICITAQGYTPAVVHASLLACNMIQWLDVAACAEGDQHGGSACAIFNGTMQWDGPQQSMYAIWARATTPLAHESQDIRADQAGAATVGCDEGQEATGLKFVGCAWVNAFRIAGLMLPQHCSGVILHVCGVNAVGSTESLSDAAFLEVSRHL